MKYFKVSDPLQLGCEPDEKKGEPCQVPNKKFESTLYEYNDIQLIKVIQPYLFYEITSPEKEAKDLSISIKEVKKSQCYLLRSSRQILVNKNQCPVTREMRYFLTSNPQELEKSIKLKEGLKNE